MKRFLVAGLATLALAALSPPTHANPPEKKPVVAAHPAIHAPVKPMVGHPVIGHPMVGHPVVGHPGFGPGPHPVHANAHDPRLGHQEQAHRAEEIHREQAVRDERARAREHAEVRDDRIARDREEHDAHLRAERARYDAAHSSSGGGGGDDSSASSGDSSDDSSADSSGDAPTDPKAAALGTLLNLLQQKH